MLYNCRLITRISSCNGEEAAKSANEPRDSCTWTITAIHDKWNTRYSVFDSDTYHYPVASMDGLV